MQLSTPGSVKTLWQTLRTDGLAHAWARLSKKDGYEEWLEEQDLVGIIAALERLSDRELGRIGMTRTTLGLDVIELMDRTRQKNRITGDILSLVENEPAHRFAAE